MESFRNMESFEMCDTPQDTNIVKRSLDMKLRSSRAKQYLLYGFYHTCVVCALVYDIYNKCPCEMTAIYIFEYILAIMLGFSTICCFLNYFIYTSKMKPLTGTKDQKKLLSFDDGDMYFKTIPDKTSSPRAIRHVSKIKKHVLLWHSSFNQTHGLPNWSYMRKNSLMQKSASSEESSSSDCSSNYDFYESSYEVNQLPQGAFHTLSQIRSNRTNISQINSPQTCYPIYNCSVASAKSLRRNYNSLGYDGLLDDVSLCSNVKRMRCGNQSRCSTEDPIFDNSGLQQYLKKLTEESNNMSNDEHLLNSIRMYPISAAGCYQTPVYHLSPPVDKKKETVSLEANPEMFSLRIIQGKCESVKHISPDKFTHYVGNLRIWIASTILKRLAQEFENIDESLKDRGILDIQIGSIALERLKKAVESEQFVNAFMPKLPLIVPFLEVSSNQEYLVQRIKDLSKGTCIAEYRWNSGAEYHGLRWDEHLPTDTAILFHLFCVYMDSQLVPLPQGDGRPFFSRYVVLGEEKRTIKDTLALVQNKSGCAILCTNILHPKFNFISDGEIHHCSYDRNNLFHVIIQFLIFIRTYHNGYLDGVHLGKSGINIMCVVED